MMYVAGMMIMSSQQQGTPQMPEMPEPGKPPQAARQPNQQARRSAAAMAGGGRGSSTQITGAGGVSPSLLNIGRGSLLGS
jgi:hypothetical protein